MTEKELIATEEIAPRETNLPWLKEELSKELPSLPSIEEARRNRRNAKIFLAMLIIIAAASIVLPIIFHQM